MLRRLATAVEDWLLADYRWRIRLINQSLDTLEQRYMSVAADVFRKRVGR